MKWVSTTLLFLMLIAMPMLGQQTASAQDSNSLSIGSWWTLKGTYRQMTTGSGSWKGTYTETGEYTDKITVTSKNSDTITLSNQEDGKWSCTATDGWSCTSKNEQEASGTYSRTYQYTIALNTLRVNSVGGDAGKDIIGHPTWYMVNVGQLTEGGKVAHHWWVPESSAKGDKITDVDFSVDSQTAKIKGADLKVWRLSYSGDTLGWWRSNGVYSSGPATRTDLYDPIYGIWVGHSFKSTTNGVVAGGAGSWTEDYSEDLQFVDTNLSFTMPVSLNTEPGGHIAVIVDGVEYGPDQLPKVFTWSIGSTHTLQVNATVEAGNGVRYVFVQWSDGSKDTSRTVASEAASYTATFKTQYELQVVSDLGDPQGSGWYDAGSQATFSVTTPQPETGFFGTLGGKVAFQRWTGDSTDSSSSASVQMDGPKTVTAQWTTDDSQPYMILGGLAAAILVVIVVAVLMMRRKGRPPTSIQPTLEDTGPPRVPPSQVAPPAVVTPPAVVPPPAAVSPSTEVRTKKRAPVPSGAPSGTKYCVFCGHVIPMDARFCTNINCGKPQD